VDGVGSYGAIDDVGELEVFRTFAGINFATVLAHANGTRALAHSLGPFHFVSRLGRRFVHDDTCNCDMIPLLSLMLGCIAS
jgi:hypothetical protein